MVARDGEGQRVPVELGPEPVEEHPEPLVQVPDGGVVLVDERLEQRRLSLALGVHDHGHESLEEVPLRRAVRQVGARPRVVRPVRVHEVEDEQERLLAVGLDPREGTARDVGDVPAAAIVVLEALGDPEAGIEVGGVGDDGRRGPALLAEVLGQGHVARREGRRVVLALPALGLQGGQLLGRQRPGPVLGRLEPREHRGVGGQRPGRRRLEASVEGRALGELGQDGARGSAVAIGGEVVRPERVADDQDHLRRSFDRAAAGPGQAQREPEKDEGTAHGSSLGSRRRALTHAAGRHSTP